MLYDKETSLILRDLNVSGVLDPANAKCYNDEDLIKVGDLVKAVVTYINSSPRGSRTVHLSFQV